MKYDLHERCDCCHYTRERDDAIRYFSERLYADPREGWPTDADYSGDTLDE